MYISSAMIFISLLVIVAHVTGLIGFDLVWEITVQQWYTFGTIILALIAGAFLNRITFSALRLAALDV
ncbi:putative membrane protein [Yersinia enterocolitica]|nr:putative membrane protein [Yersinia enterocolitica]